MHIKESYPWTVTLPNFLFFSFFAWKIFSVNSNHIQAFDRFQKVKPTVMVNNFGFVQVLKL